MTKLNNVELLLKTLIRLIRLKNIVKINKLRIRISSEGLKILKRLNFPRKYINMTGFAENALTKILMRENSVLFARVLKLREQFKYVE